MITLLIVTVRTSWKEWQTQNSTLQQLSFEWNLTFRTSLRACVFSVLLLSWMSIHLQEPAEKQNQYHYGIIYKIKCNNSVDSLAPNTYLIMISCLWGHSPSLQNDSILVNSIRLHRAGGVSVTWWSGSPRSRPGLCPGCCGLRWGSAGLAARPHAPPWSHSAETAAHCHRDNHHANTYNRVTFNGHNWRRLLFKIEDAGM